MIILNGSIYIIRNYINDKVYIGQTIQPVNLRFNRHMCDAKRKNTKFHKAVMEIGKEFFYYAVLESGIDDREIGEREQYYIRKYDSINSGYNKGIGGEHNNRVIIPDDVLLKAKEMYLNGYTLSETAKGFNTTRDVLSPRLQVIGVAIRKWNEVQKINATKEDLVRLYCDEMMTTYEIADIYNTSNVTIQKHLKRHGIKLRTGMRKEYLTPKVNKETLYDLYVTQGKSHKKTAEALNVCIATVQYWVKRYGFNRSTPCPISQ